MSRRRANRLFPQEIDEVSSVDSPANQHGLIAIAKRDGAADMPKFFDADDNEVDLDTAQVGSQIFDEEGQPYTVLSDEDIEAMVEAGQLDPAAVVALDGDEEYDEEYEDEPVLSGVGKRGGLGALTARGRGAPAISGGQHSSAQAGRGRRRRDLGEPRRMGKSLGDTVLGELRKALSDADRDQVIGEFAKAFDTQSNRIEELTDLVGELVEDRESERYATLAKRFDAVPADEATLAGILRVASQSMSKRQLDVLEQILTAAGEANIYGELGYGGGSSGNSVMDDVRAAAFEVVGKAGDLTYEQATTALFTSNPDAYEAYLAENAQN